MERRPTAAKIISPSTVYIYDQIGNYLNCASSGGAKIASVFVTPQSMTMNLADGRINVFELAPNRSPVLRYSR